MITIYMNEELNDNYSYPIEVASIERLDADSEPEEIAKEVAKSISDLYDLTDLHESNINLVALSECEQDSEDYSEASDFLEEEFDDEFDIDEDKIIYFIYIDDSLEGYIVRG